MTEPPRDRAKDDLAARLVHEVMSEPLPPFLPGEPPGLAATLEAAARAPRILRALSRVYGVERWDYDSFHREVLLGALAAWRPGTRVREDGRTLLLTAPRCPLAAAVARDPRRCLTCHLVVEVMARLAMPGEVARVTFEELLSRGDPLCVMRMQRRPQGAGLGESVAEAVA